MNKGNIILLNGTSSAGKTTLAKSVQDGLNAAYYHVCSDDFVHMTPRQILHDDFNRQMGLTQEIMRETISLFSDRGHHVIADDVIVDLPEVNWLQDYYRRFEGYPVLFVRVDCPLVELERREKARGDRQIGHARWLLQHLDLRVPYDLVVNTGEMSTEQCVEEIRRMLDHPERWKAFSQDRSLGRK
jgi:chloramphenicol 3-O phosphotransferase